MAKVHGVVGKMPFGKYGGGFGPARASKADNSNDSVATSSILMPRGRTEEDCQVIIIVSVDAYLLDIFLLDTTTLMHRT